MAESAFCSYLPSRSFQRLSRCFSVDIRAGKISVSASPGTDQFQSYTVTTLILYWEDDEPGKRERVWGVIPREDQMSLGLVWQKALVGGPSKAAVWTYSVKGKITQARKP